MNSASIAESIRKIEETSESALTAPSRYVGMIVIGMAGLVMAGSSVYTSYRQSQVIAHQDTRIADASKRFYESEEQLEIAIKRLQEMTQKLDAREVWMNQLTDALRAEGLIDLPKIPK